MTQVEQGTPAGASVLGELSELLAGAVERAGGSIVRVDARRRQSASGIVWSADGLVLTADHVLERDEDLAVGLPDGQTVSARIVGRDPSADLALLRAEAAGLRPLAPGEAPRVGHLALIVARPGPAGLATSLGVVSALGGPARTWRGGQLERFVRTDATFYPGFSGGALVDSRGELLGLATSGFGQAAGLVIPLETLQRVAAALLSHGRVRRGYLGLSSQPVALPAALRSALAVEQESGLLVVGVEPGGPAEQAGLLIGDLLLALAGQPLRGTEDLRAALGPDSVGQSIAAGLIRGGERRELAVTIGERS
jgi:S1-C subfamily serine protease